MSAERDNEMALRTVDADHQAALIKLAHRCTLAEALAPCFRDKFDFSEPKQFDALAEMAVTAADALIRKQEALLAEEKKRYTDAQLAANKAFSLACIAEQAALKAKENAQEAGR